MRERMERIRLAEGRVASSHAFVSIYIWASEQGLTVSLEEDGFTVRNGDGNCFFPCGTEEYKRRAITGVLEDGVPGFLYVGERDAALLRREYGGRFEIKADAGSSEYVYHSSELAGLPGARYYSVRRELKRAVGKRHISVEPVTEENIPELAAITEEWNCYHAPDGGTYGDTVPARAALNRFAELGLFGVLVRADGKAASYAVGSDIGGLLDVHLTKSSESAGGNDYMGLTAFAGRYGVDGFETDYEEDLNIAGLRDRKQRLKPVRMIELYRGVAK